MLFSKLSEKTTELVLMSLIILMYIAMCAEADMYVPAFPEMVEYFSVAEDKIQLILSVNFAGLCLASLICGPLSDVWGRRKVLLVGLFFFAVSSIACVFSESFNTLLAWRLLQGMSASVPMVVSCAIFLDKYPLQKASQMIGVLNSVITAAMAAAPIVGAWLSYVLNWRANFIVIAVLTILSFIGALLFIGESLPLKNRKPLNILSILKDYSILLRCPRFLGYGIMALAPFVCIVVYIANLSLIFVNHLSIPIDEFGYYQATTMGAFLIFSAISSKLIAKKGVEYTKNLGSLGVIIGSSALLITALFYPESPLLICSAMAIFAAGGAMIVGIFGMKALSLYPEMKGTGSAMLTAVRQLLAAGLVFVSEITFDGSIVPVASILFAYIVVATIWYALIHRPVVKRLEA